jgi:hypothetical protein
MQRPVSMQSPPYPDIIDFRDHLCFHQTAHFNLVPWYYLVTQSKTSVSALNLSRTLSFASNTALLIKHKLQQVMKLRDDSKPLAPVSCRLMIPIGALKKMTAIAAEVSQVRSSLLLPR